MSPDVTHALEVFSECPGSKVKLAAASAATVVADAYDRRRVDDRDPDCYASFERFVLSC